jgi:integrase
MAAEPAFSLDVHPKARRRPEGTSSPEGCARALQRDESTANRDALSSWIKRAERRAGLAITARLQTVRHTFCSRLAIRGATTKTIQELAGHASLTTTQRYMHLSPAAKESAIRLLEFGVGGERGEGGGASEENRR